MITKEQVLKAVKNKDIEWLEDNRGEEVEYFFLEGFIVSAYEYSVFTVIYNGEDKLSLAVLKKLVRDIYISNKFQDIVGLEIDDDMKVRVLEKYPHARSVWVSDKGNVFINNKNVKPGKLLKVLNPMLSEIDISDIVDTLKVKSLPLGKMVCMYGSITELYNDPKLKIGSCMTDSDIDLSIFDKLNVEGLAIKGYNGNIIARVLIHDKRYFDRVYATSYALEERVEQFVQQLGYKCIPTEYSVTIKDDGEPIPYMDNLKFVTQKGDELTFGMVSEVATHEANRTDGGLSKI